MISRHLAGLLIVLLPLGSGIAEIFQETFQRTSIGGNWAVSQLEWLAYVGESASDVSEKSANAGTDDFVAITNASGNPSGETGALFIRNDLTRNQIFAVVKMLPAPLSIPRGSFVRWMMGNESPDAVVRILVQVEGDGRPESGRWFISAEEFRSAKKTSYSSFQEFSDAPKDEVQQEFQWPNSPAAWENFTLKPKALMKKEGGHPAESLSLPVTGIGFWVESDRWLGKPVRIDTLIIE